MNHIHILIEHIITNWPFLTEAMNPKEVQFLTQKFKDEAEDFNINISDEDIKNAINTFDTKFKQDPNVTEKDLRKYSLTQLLKLISAKPGFEKGTAEKKIETTPDMVYNEDGIVIYSGDVEDKCIKYGAGERWCITRGSYGNYRFDPQRGYPIFYLVKNTNLPDNDPLSFVAIQVRNNGEYVYTNRLNNPHESEEMSFDGLLDEVPYLTSIDDLKSILKYIPPNIKEKNKEQRFKEGISFSEWTNNLDFNDKKLYLSIRGPIVTKEQRAGQYERTVGQLFTNLSTEAFVTKVLPKYDKLTEWLFQNPWIFNFNILLNNIELFKPPYQKSLLTKVNSPGHPINVTGKDILDRKFDFNISKTLVNTNKIPNSKEYNFYVTENGNAIVNIGYDRTGVEVDVITEDETYKDIKLSKRTQKYLFDFPGIVNIPLDSLARAIQVNDLDSDKITDVIDAARKSNDTSKKIIKVGNTEVLFDTSGNLLKTYQIENNSIKPVDNNNEDVIKATDQFVEDAISNEEIQNNLVTSILNRTPMFNNEISSKILANIPKDKLTRGLEGVVSYNNNLYSFVLPESFEFKGYKSVNGRMTDTLLGNNLEMGAAYGEFLKNNNVELTNNMITNLFERNRWRTPYSSKVTFASTPDLPYAEGSTYRLTVNDGKIYIVNTANPAESFRISEKTGRILQTRAPRTVAPRATPAQLGAGERVAAPLAGAGRRGRPAGGANRPVEGNISDDLNTTLTNSNLSDGFNQLPLNIRSRFFGDSTRGNLRNDRGVSRRDNLLGNLGHVDFVRTVGASSIYGIQLDSGNVVASVVAQPGNSHWLITQNGAFQLDSPANLVAALRQRNLTEMRDYIVNEYMERNPNQVNELKNTIKKHIKETKNI
jgi:hypothetical protein